MSEHRVIIVTGEGYESEYARKLHALLSDKKINSAIWTEIEFLANRPKVSNKERLIFFGLGKETIKQATVITEWAFNSYACRIGWLGSICVITARDGSLWYESLRWDELEAFSHYCKAKAEKHPDIIVPSEKSADEIWNVIKGIFTDKNNKSAWRAQYSLLIYEFIDNWLDKFMGIEQDNEV